MSNCSLASPAKLRTLTDVAFEGTDFEDTDYGATKPRAGAGRAPTREELDAQLTGTQQQLAKLRETQEQLERARASLEEMRRRRTEFALGLTEMRQQLTRGVGLLEKAELNARRDAEQLERSLSGLHSGLSSLEHLGDQSWTDQNWEQELTRALTVIENARLEYNGARLKWTMLDGPTAPLALSAAGHPAFTELPLGQLCKFGLALTWPLVLAAVLVFIGLLLLLLRH